MSAPLPPRTRRRRWLTLAGIAGLVLLALLLLLLALLQSQAVRGQLLLQASRLLQLELTASHVDVRLRGSPQLVLDDAVARRAGDPVALLHARRIRLALPWRTLRSLGDDLTITRIELDAPRIDLPALQRWLASRPPAGKPRIPTLSNGLSLRDGRIDNDDWRIEQLAISLPRLSPAKPVRMSVRGRYLAPPLAVQADLTITLDSPQALLDQRPAQLGSTGALTVEGASWSLPARVSLSGPLQLGKDSVLLRPIKLGIAARYRAGATDVPFRVGLFGPMAFNDARWRFVPVTVVLDGDGSIPDARAHGSVSVGKQLRLHLDGSLGDWPHGWPALPLPASRTPLRFSLDYRGAIDLAEPSSLSLQRDDNRFDARFRLPGIIAWLEAAGQGSPLPPLSGHLVAPRVELDGVTMQGVEVELDDTP